MAGSFGSMSIRRGEIPKDFGELSHLRHEWRCRQGVLAQTEYLRNLGICTDKYRVLDPEVGRRLVARGEAVAISMDWFVYGVRLPLDPLICRILQECNAQPDEVCPRAVLIIVCFATIVRSYGIDVSSELFSYFFRVCFDRVREKIFCKEVAGVVQLVQLPEEVLDWETRMVYVESRVGWSFKPARGRVGGIRRYKGLCYREGKNLKRFLERQLGAVYEGGRIVYQEMVYDWKQCVRGDFHYKVGQGGEKLELPYLFRLSLVEVCPDGGWVKHCQGVFPSDCRFCRLCEGGEEVVGDSGCVKGFGIEGKL